MCEMGPGDCSFLECSVTPLGFDDVYHIVMFRWFLRCLLTRVVLVFLLKLSVLVGLRI